MSDSRREAAFILTRWLETYDFPDRMMTNTANRAFVQNLVYTTIRRKDSLLWVLQKFVKHLPKGEVEALLLLGAAQILFMRDVPDHAAVNETVEAAKRTSRSVAQLLNAVLRRLIVEREALLVDLEQQPDPVRFSHPKILVQRWTQQFGLESCHQLCTWNNTSPETIVSPLDGRTSPYEEVPGCPGYFVLPHGIRLEQVDGFNEGAFIVQDPATGGAVALMKVSDGMTVLDACAAPGGKTVRLALLNPNGLTVAMERHEDRLAQLNSTLLRTKQQQVKIIHGDATTAESYQEMKFDRILVDVPCSNSGVLRRRPDARWRWSERRLKKLIDIQKRILETALKALKPDGILVYSTCSIEPEENQKQVDAILPLFPGLRCIETRIHLPFTTGTDGAFAAALAFQG